MLLSTLVVVNDHVLSIDDVVVGDTRLAPAFPVTSAILGSHGHFVLTVTILIGLAVLADLDFGHVHLAFRVFGEAAGRRL